MVGKMGLFVTVVLLGMVIAASCNVCPNRNNFGKDCAYECHCSGNQPCNEDGSCPNGCADGWSGEYCQMGNAAQGKNATQSSTITDFRASLAVDGRTSQARPHCTYTYQSDQPWWMVDLGRDYVLSGLRIFTCSSCGGPGSFKIWMRNSPSTDSSSGNLCYHYAPGYISSGASPTITCTTPAVGRYLIIKRMETDNLVLCEVITDAFQFRACENKRYGPNCNIQCQCANNISCDVSTGVCPSGCNENYTGPSCNLPRGKGLPMLSKTESTSNSVAVQWPNIRPHDSGNDTWSVSRYELKYHPEKSTNQTKTVSFPSPRGLISHNVTGLEPLTNYSYQIGAVYRSTKTGQVIESEGPVTTFKTLAMIWPGGCPKQNNFGKHCAYECHCSGNQPCYEDGSCPNGCADGWSGWYCQRGNAARGKNATQSSTVGYFRASRAVDGGRSRSLFYCTYTYTSDNAWWRVDLGRDHVLLGLSMMTSYTIDDIGPRSKIWMRDTPSTDSSSGNLCSHLPHGRYVRGPLPWLRCSTPAIGRYLIIKLMEKDNLVLCEVVIDAFQFRECDNKRYGPNCNIQCQCANNVSCDVSTGVCPSGCNDNYTGPSCNLPRGKGLPIVSKTESTSNSITVQWPYIRPRDSIYNKWSVKQFELKYYPEESTNSTKTVQFPSPTRLISHTVTGLEPLTNYHFQIGVKYRSVPNGQEIESEGPVSTFKTLAV
ncbi:uncharacterized protein LOC135486235 [Lineus longissimus]|uniref:uncharacterized protein LOC135486235 n=1 Tax=Lineus longissimus TaxID=88925 RepID=UPI002B4D89B4